MTQQMADLMKMAREAGAIRIHEKPKDVALVGIDAIERFAQLVAKKAVEAEREACAALCESLDDASYPTRRVWPSECAEAIRARGNA